MRRTWVVCTALILLALFAMPFVTGRGRAVPVMRTAVSARSWPVVVLDAGHGGGDGGAGGPNGLLEKTLNLDVTLRVDAFLDALGVETVLTRTDDTMHPDGKVADIKARAAAAEAAGENVLFVSIHMNKFPQTSSHGTQVFFGSRNDESDEIALFVQQRVVSMLQPENHRTIQPGTDNVYLLTHLDCPAILVECGFLSNSNDVALLSDDTYRSRLAFVITGALASYYGSPAEPQGT